MKNSALKYAEYGANAIMDCVLGVAGRNFSSRRSVYKGISFILLSCRSLKFSNYACRYTRKNFSSTLTSIATRTVYKPGFIHRRKRWNGIMRLKREIPSEESFLR